MAQKTFKTFEDFYPFYIKEHSHSFNKFLHFFGTTGFLLSIVFASLEKNPLIILGGIIFAYGLAWIGHYLIEHNRPATFQYPLYSLRGDFKMFWELLTLQRSF